MTRSSRCAALCTFLLLAIDSGACQETALPVTLRQSGWTIEFQPSSASLKVSSDLLGEIVRDIRLNEDTPSGLMRVTHLTAKLGSDGELIVESTGPKTAWIFRPKPGKLEIETTDFHGLLTGSAVTPDGRVVSRLVDPLGEPVVWEGTGEAVVTYGGERISKPSYLPRRNPEVLYLGLGHVSGTLFHSLFDRNTDTAIDFGDGATLRAAPGHEEAYAVAIPVRDRATIQIIADYYTQVLGLPFYQRYDDSHFSSAPMVWSSWTSYYEAVTEEDIVRNADWLSAKLRPYGFEYVQLDDGYDRQPEGHSWVENWNRVRFPHGPQWLANHIHSDGLKAGIWLVPNAYAPAFKEHPDWYLYDKQGKVLIDYQTPTLDPTNPAVFDHLKNLFTRLDDFGFDYFKFDGEQAFPVYAPTVDRSRLHSPSIDFLENYRRRLALIRRTIGPNRFIEVCPTGTPLDGVGYIDSYFNGDDLYNNWQGMYSAFSAITANLFLNHMVSYVMPGEGLELGRPMSVAEAIPRRPAITIATEREREEPLTGFGTTLPEARTLVSYVALTGVAYPLASVMPELPEERVRLLQATMPTMPILPIDLFSRGTESSWDKFKHVTQDYYIHHYPELLDLKVNSAAGTYDVAAETNWRSETTDRRLDLSNQLGLQPGKYVIFDFWNKKPLGIFENYVDLKIAPHDTRVLMVHPLLDRPQLVANSRHISGTYSIVNQGWDARAQELAGESATIPGEEYTLWFHISRGEREHSARVATKDGAAIPAQWQERDGFASLRFVGVQESAEWSVTFQTTAQ